MAEIERVIIKNFLSLEFADIELAHVTALIGPQASGKSIVAKAVYFGRDYISDIVEEGLDEAFKHRSFKAGRVEKFLKLFGGLNGFDGSFEITYFYKDFEVKIDRPSVSGRPRVQHSKALSDLITKIKRRFDAIKKEKQGANVYYSRHRYLHSKEFREEFTDLIPNALFVPAARSFFSTISDNVFSFLAADERVDILTAQFGSFYELARQDIFYLPGEKNISHFRKSMANILDGDYHRQKNDDFIVTRWGKVPLSSASSGQQEALPLLFALFGYPIMNDGSRLLIIEEPEAHLFPTAQKQTLDQIMLAAETGCRILFTTHSPYMLSYLNTFVARYEKNKTDVSIAAFQCGSRTASSIVEESGFLDLDGLDGVSEEIVQSFLKEV